MSKPNKRTRLRMRKKHNLTWSRTSHHGSHWLAIKPIYTQKVLDDIAKYGDRPSSDFYGNYATCATSGEVIGSVVNGSKKLRSVKPLGYILILGRRNNLDIHILTISE